MMDGGIREGDLIVHHSSPHDTQESGDDTYKRKHWTWRSHAHYLPWPHATYAVIGMRMVGALS